MVATIVDLDFISDLLGRELTDTEKVRAQLDINSVTGTLERWLRRKLVETTITDERHIALSEYEPLRFKWRPVKSLTGVRWDLITNDLDTSLNNYRDDPFTVYRDQTYFVSYVTDASEVLEYIDTFKLIISNVVINGLLKSDPVRYNVINSYSVEGLSVTYNGGGAITDPKAVGPISGTDLASISTLRNTVIL